MKLSLALIAMTGIALGQDNATATTAATITEFPALYSYTTKRLYDSDSGSAPEPSNPYAPQNDDFYGSSGTNYNYNGAADNNNINYGMGYGGNGGPDNGEEENANPNGIGVNYLSFYIVGLGSGSSL